MNINQRFTEIVNVLYSGNKRHFAKIIGVNPTVIENVVGKRQGNPSFEVVQKILSAIANINPDWLITGQGTMLRSSVPELASEGRLPVEGGVSPPVCVLCVAKDETIAALKAQIEVQSEYIGLLKEQCPPGSGQKRKQECA